MRNAGEEGSVVVQEMGRRQQERDSRNIGFDVLRGVLARALPEGSSLP